MKGDQGGHVPYVPALMKLHQGAYCSLGSDSYEGTSGGPCSTGEEGHIEPTTISEWTAFLATKPNKGPMHGQPRELYFRHLCFIPC